MMARKVSKKRALRLINKYAREEGIGEYAPYLAAQIEQESGFQTNLGSSAGAQDIAQFMPGTAPSYGVTLGDNRIKDDLRGQARMMAKLIKQTGSIEDALRGYNAGPGAIEASKGYAETNHYVDVVTRNAKKYKTANQPSGGTFTKAGSKSRYGAPSFQTTPGVDNSGVRQGLMQQYLSDRGRPDALLSLGLSLRDAQDTPATTSLVPGQRSTNPGRSAGGGTRGKRVDVNELFYDPLGWYLDEGKQQSGGIGGHGDHLHASANSESGAVRIGKWAERMGLTVREQSHFDPVDPVHTDGSFHYSDRAVDVSGDPKKLRKLARKVRRRAK
jgi:hypothetical protein